VLIRGAGVGADCHVGRTFQVHYGDREPIIEENLLHTAKIDTEIDDFAKMWVRQNAEYRALGSNCQDFAKALFAFLTGKTLAIPTQYQMVRQFPLSPFKLLKRTWNRGGHIVSALYHIDASRSRFYNADGETLDPGLRHWYSFLKALKDGWNFNPVPEEGIVTVNFAAVQWNS